MNEFTNKVYSYILLLEINKRLSSKADEIEVENNDNKAKLPVLFCKNVLQRVHGK